MPEETILAQWDSQGQEKLVEAAQRVITELKSAEVAAKLIDDTLIKLAKTNQITGSEFMALAANTKAVSKEMDNAARAEAQLAQQSATALGRFSLATAGSIENLKKIETNAYNASRQMTFFSQQMVTHPIATLKQFTASAEKAAVAGEFFRQQLAFIAASRFGAIAIGAAVFGGIEHAIRATIAAGAELEVEVRRVESAFLGAEKTSAEFGQIQQKIVLGAVQFGHGFKDIGTMLWELKSAGLSASDAMAGLDTAQRLVVAGLTDIKMGTRLVAGMFRIYGDSVAYGGSAQEKFAAIGDRLGYVLNKSQADLDGLTQGFKYAISSGELAGFSFNQISSYLSVLNNRMLFGSTAGTGLVNSFVQISKNSEKIAEKFNIVIDRTKTLGEQFDFILKQLHDRFGSANLSVKELGDMFETMNIRGGRAMAALIKGFDELQNTSKELNGEIGSVKGTLEELSKTKMNTLTTEWDRFKMLVKSTQALGAEGADSLGKSILKWSTDTMELHERFSKITGDMRQWNAVNSQFSVSAEAFKKQLAGITGDSNMLLEVLRKYPKEISILFYMKGLDASIKDTETLLKKIKEVQQESAREAGRAAAMESIWAQTANKEKLAWDELVKGQEKLDHWREVGLISLKEEASILKDRILKQQQAVANAVSEQSVTMDEEVKKLAELNKEYDKVVAAGEKEKSLALDNLRVVEEFRQKVLSIKELNPAAQIRSNVEALKAAKAELDASTQGTREWREAVKKVGEATLQVEKNWELVNKAIDKANAEQNKYFDTFMKYKKDQISQGHETNYGLSRELQAQREGLQFKATVTMDPKEELKIREQIDQLLEKEKEVSSDWQIERNRQDNLKREFELQKRINDETTQGAADAKGKWAQTEQDVKAMMEDISKSLADWPAHIKDVGALLETDLNQGLEKTAELIDQATKKMQKLSDVLSNMGSGPGGNALKMLEDALHEATNRGA